MLTQLIFALYTASISVPYAVMYNSSKVADTVQTTRNIHKLVPSVYKVRNAYRCLSQNLYFEARNQPIAGQYAVSYVVLNRVTSPLYPNTICEVVLQEYQFSWTHDGKSDTPSDKQAWEHAKTLAKQIYVTHVVYPRVYLDGALYYHASYVSPEWTDYKTRVKIIASHIFYK